MDTKQAAEFIGTTPRVLRQFLRSGYSTFVPVGSGSRYEFKDTEMGTLMKRFSEWKSVGKPRPDSPAKSTKPSATTSPSKLDKQRARDQKEWKEEGPVVLEDIRNPRVRSRVLADARAAEDRLMLRLMAAGLHLTQLGDRKSA